MHLLRSQGIVFAFAFAFGFVARREAPSPVLRARCCSSASVCSSTENTCRMKEASSARPWRISGGHAAGVGAAAVESSRRCRRPSCRERPSQPVGQLSHLLCGSELRCTLSRVIGAHSQRSDACVVYDARFRRRHRNAVASRSIAAERSGRVLRGGPSHASQRARVERRRSTARGEAVPTSWQRDSKWVEKTASDWDQCIRSDVARQASSRPETPRRMALV